MRELHVVHRCHLHFLQVFGVFIEVSAAETGRVDQTHFPIFEHPFSGGAVPGSVRLFVHEKLVVAKKLVDKGGFTHVWAADDAQLDCFFEVGVVGGGATPCAERLLWFGKGFFVWGIFIKLTIVLRIGVKPQEFFFPLSGVNRFAKPLDLVPHFLNNAGKSLLPSIPLIVNTLPNLIRNFQIDPLEELQDPIALLCTDIKYLRYAHLD
jgi:hypothetical protein